MYNEAHGEHTCYPTKKNSRHLFNESLLMHTENKVIIMIKNHNKSNFID